MAQILFGALCFYLAWRWSRHRRTTMKRCPFCTSVIPLAAVRCPQCAGDLRENGGASE